ncbi:MAG: PAS domain S-box protein [Sulfuritalea sp.]|nr:PAS domain S-box protein [Sulfuritalea sp.]
MRLTDWLQWHSLKTRVTLLSLGVFLVGIWSLSFYSIRLLREDLHTQIGEQQFATVSALATDINESMEERLAALTTVAASIDQTTMGSLPGLKALLKQRPILGNLFNGGVIVHGIDGTAITDVPLAAGRIGVNYMDIDVVAAALKEGRSTIGAPVMGKRLGVPVFGMAVPIRDALGRVTGALSGVTQLDRSSFLDKLAQNHSGKSGSYMLVAKRQRMLITATDPRLRMVALPAPGQNALIDSFIQGHEGSGVTVNPLGIEVLGSVKGIPAADWYVAIARPTAEVFGPLKAMQQRMLLAALAMTLLVGVLTWWMLKRQLSPLLDTVTALTAFRDTNQLPQPLPIAKQNEIGELIDAFNHLLTTLAQREETLRESEERYRSFFHASPDAVFVHRDDIIIFANDATAQLFHSASVTELIGRDWHDLVTKEDWPVTEMRIARLMSGEAPQMPALERRHLTLDGQDVSVESSGVRIIFDGKPAVLSVIRDITARKHTEAQRLADARQQRDTLVREVHHRIKNNLQSVAGLLQRELGRFMELDPRLETAISQVHAIAVVHGLQSAGPEETVRLCDSARNICRMVAELSLRPVNFQIENERTTFMPVEIASDQAVPVALVLNELILNAVKHSPADGPASTVSLSTDNGSARIVIRNAVSSLPPFNFATGSGLGTGLRLVSSLLPDQGAQLHYEPVEAGVLRTILTLTPPVIGSFHGKESGSSS